MFGEDIEREEIDKPNYILIALEIDTSLRVRVLGFENFGAEGDGVVGFLLELLFGGGGFGRRAEEGGGFVVVFVGVGVFGGFAFVRVGSFGVLGGFGGSAGRGGGAVGGGFEGAFDALVFLAGWGVLVGWLGCWKGCGGEVRMRD